MRTWLALLVAPLMALADQSINYAIAGWDCAGQRTVPPHAVHLAFLAGTLVATVLAWRLWQATRPAQSAPEDQRRRHFLAGIATASAALSALTVAAMWIASWLLPACVN